MLQPTLQEVSGRPEARLLYLGFAFPPGMAALHPSRNPAGHALETQMVNELRRYFEVRSVGILPIEPEPTELADPASGIEHELLLLEKAPEVWHRFNSFVRLQRQYRAWCASGWEPDAVLVYNLSPIYNQFLNWLRRQPCRPKLVLLLADSSNLGQKTRWLKQFRRRFKPMFTPDSEMIGRFDACVGLSRGVQKYFQPHQIPFLWMPGGCTPARAFRNHAPRTSATASPGRRFGYFGALGAHSGVRQLIKAFQACETSATLEVCGYGKVNETLDALLRSHPRVIYHGLKSPDECLNFGRSCDVLVNPRPATHGNENNFASKLFDYALCGRAIMTTWLSGVQEVLGPEAFYLDAHNLEADLQRELARISGIPRRELKRRGEAIQARVLSNFSWPVQAYRMASFLREVCGLPALALETQDVPNRSLVASY
ncbi:MAG TPA: glycosyltransferase [Verrucomicrobiae bacterium]|nr:glycosyltransferase [Verrucomicrobiae bacterium]